MKNRTNQILQQIKNAEARLDWVNEDQYRLAFHLSPPVGWMNDPNGLCQFKGVYHVFFQYAPTDSSGGLKCWGHYTSRDLLSWEYVGTPILPDQMFDKDGAYSGCAWAEENCMHIFYTGNVKKEGNYDYIYQGRTADTIYCSSVDGIHFSKKEVILGHSEYPSGYSCHIRDPKVWKEQEFYYMVLGARTTDNQGKVLLYASMNLKDWNLKYTIKTSEKFGYMWECPDYFKVGEKKILSISPQGLLRERERYQNIYQSGYFLLEKDILQKCNLKESDLRECNLKVYNLNETDFEEWDYGFDFYAPQSFLDEAGRRILIGWMGLPDLETEYSNPTVSKGWQHCLTLFRQIVVEKEKIRQVPLEEYKKLRTQKEVWDMKEPFYIPACCEIIIESPWAKDFLVNIDEGLNLQWKREKQEFSISFLNDLGRGRGIRRVKILFCKHIRIFFDHSSMEIFLNQGEKVLTTRIYPKNVEHIKLQCLAGKMETEVYLLNAMEVSYRA